jgi:hypothetical protein
MLGLFKWPHETILHRRVPLLEWGGNLLVRRRRKTGQVICFGNQAPSMNRRLAKIYVLKLVRRF